VLHKIESQVFRGEEFPAHLERVAASEDDLRVEPSEQAPRPSSGSPG
jgi:hypothetical protein